MIEALINLKDKMGDTLDTREAAMTLFQDMRDCCSHNRKITFDFSGVDFVSRSFADQFHKERLKLFEETGCIGEIKDAEQHVFDMLQTVSKTQSIQKNKLVYYPIYTFESQQNLSAYLQGI